MDELFANLNNDKKNSKGKNKIQKIFNDIKSKRKGKAKKTESKKSQKVKPDITLKSYSEITKSRRKIFVIGLIIWIILMTIAFQTFLKPKKITNPKQLLMQTLEKTNLLSYTDLEGFKTLTDKINISSLESNTKISFKGTKTDVMETSSLPLDKMMFNISSKVDNIKNKYKSDIDLKIGETTLLKFELLDDAKNVGIQSNDFFKEYIAIEKASIKTVIDNLNEQSINIADDTNNIKEYLNKVVSSNQKVNIYSELIEIEKKYNEFLKEEMLKIEDKNFTANTRVPTKYKNKDVKVDNVNISINKKQYVEIMKTAYTKTINEIKNNKEKYTTISTIVEEAEKKNNTTIQNNTLTKDQELNKQLKELNPLNKNNQTNIQGNNTKQQTGITDPLMPTQPFNAANTTQSPQTQTQNTPNNQGQVNNQVNNRNGISNTNNNNNNNTTNTNTNTTTNNSVNNNTNNNIKATEKVQDKNTLLRKLEMYLVPEESKLKEIVNIRMYMISKQDFKIDVYDQNKDDNTEQKILTLEVSKEKNTKEIGLENYLIDKKIILKTTEDDNNVYTNIEIKKQEKVQDTQNINLTPKTDKLTLEITRKKSNGSDAFKKINIIRNNQDNVFNMQIENNIQFKDNVVIQTDKQMQLLNTLSATDLDNLMSKVVFPQVKKVLKQKRFIMQNLANSSTQLNNTNPMQNQGQVNNQVQKNTNNQNAPQSNINNVNVR
ncbi:MAG: hypothetical protein ACTTGJ_02105 [Clostridium sp.]